MIVFYLFISIICIAIILLLSSVKLDIKNIQIENFNKLKGIFLSIENKRYDKIFDYIKIKINISLVLFNIIPIIVVKINEKNIKDIIKKIIIKDLKEKKQNEKKFRIKRIKQKKIIQKIQKRVKSHVKLQDSELNVDIGLTNAGVTAIATGILNILFSILVIEIVNKIIEKEPLKKDNIQFKDTIQKFKYKVIPVYSPNYEFRLKSRIKIKLPVLSFI